MPPQLERQVGAWWTQDPLVVPESVPKETERLLYALDDGVHVAVTEGPEVEVVWSNRRKDGAIDVAAYGADGKRTDRAPLRMGSSIETLPAPYACLLCHRNLTTLAFDVVHP